jgi:enoyl-CoA hydratase
VTATDAGTVELTRPRDGVAWLRLQRPAARNALSLALLDDLGAALGEVATDDDVRCVVLTGTDGAFCAGLDLVELERDPPALLHHEAPQQLRRLPKPIVAAVDGAAVTGGMELALAADVRLGSERARFADTHTLVGLVPGWGMSVRLPAVVGRSAATLLSLTGRFVASEEAHRIGLLDELVPSDQLEARTLEVAAAIADADPVATATLLELYRSRADDEDERARTREDELFTRWVRDLDGAEIGRRRQRVIERGRAASARPEAGQGEGERR